VAASEAAARQGRALLASTQRAARHRFSVARAALETCEAAHVTSAGAVTAARAEARENAAWRRAARVAWSDAGDSLRRLAKADPVQKAQVELFLSSFAATFRAEPRSGGPSGAVLGNAMAAMRLAVAEMRTSCGDLGPGSEEEDGEDIEETASEDAAPPPPPLPAVGLGRRPRRLPTQKKITLAPTVPALVAPDPDLPAPAERVADTARVDFETSFEKASYLKQLLDTFEFANDVEARDGDPAGAGDDDSDARGVKVEADEALLAACRNAVVMQAEWAGAGRRSCACGVVASREDAAFCRGCGARLPVHQALGA